MAEDGTGLEPLTTPSAFVDLDHDPALQLQDHLLLLSRMLMETEEEDIHHGNLCDHPALLRAQQPFADILTGAAAPSPGSSSFTVSPSSSDDVPAFSDNATWPYDPLELSQRLTLPAGHDDGVQSQQSAVAKDRQSTSGTRTNTAAAADDASILFSSNTNNRVDMDMLNQAFLKGLEEANKFLPSLAATTLLTDTSSSTAEATATATAKKKQKKNKAAMVDDLEGETGRKSKVMVPEPEETGDRVDKMVTDGYALCLDQLKSLSIAMAADNNKKNKKNSRMSSRNNNGGRRSEEAAAVDLRTMLLQCAQAVSTGDHASATRLLSQINHHSSPTGDASQRLAHCFAEGLQARLAGTGSELYGSLTAKRVPAVDFLGAYVMYMYLAVTCSHLTGYHFANKTIKKAVAGKKKLHIVDYGVQYGCQWPHLLEYLSKQDGGGGPPAVRMTCIDVPQPGFRPVSRIQDTGNRLSAFARRCGLPSFTFHGIAAANWETVRAADLIDIDSDADSGNCRCVQRRWSF